MNVEVVVSAVNREFDELVASMNLKSDAVIINQSNTDMQMEKTFPFGTVKFYQYAERGVGVSRNRGIDNSSKDIILFSDEDITYVDDYKNLVLGEFEKHPDADMLLFNMEVCESRFTYYTKELTRIKWYNSGRYPTYSFAIKRESLIKSKVRFSELFGGGAKYSCGEDSLFLKNLVDAGLKIYAVPVTIGSEAERESSWFKGYNEKFFFDRGVLYHFLYGWLAYPMAVRFIIKKKSFMCTEIPAKKALNLIKSGIKQGKIERKNNV